MRLTNVDLPTLGRPMMAILIPSFSLGPGMRLASSPSATISSSPSSGSSASSLGKLSRAISSIWVMPRPWAPAIGIAWPMPNGANSARAMSGSMLSTLLATT
ncbi:hypothetical protein D9M69_713920 [compost metagenome]